MFGEPEDREGECNAHLYIGDDYGDNHATMRCGLPKGHKGLHRETFEREKEDGRASTCTVTWEVDERCWHDWVALETEEGKKAAAGHGHEDYSYLCANYLYVCSGCGDTEGYVNEELDRLYEEVDDLLTAGDFHVVDEKLAATDPRKLPTTVTVGWLTVTSPARDKLRNREDFVRRAREYFSSRESDERVKDLLRGLE